MEDDKPTTVHPEYPELRQVERRPFRPFKSSEEYLYAMKEDLAEWLNTLYDDLGLTAENFVERLETGVTLCRHANGVRKAAIEWQKESGRSTQSVPQADVVYRCAVQPGTFQARDNVSNFISWCRALQIFDCLLFETDDLVMRKNEKSFILCLLEVARLGARFGMLVPLLVQMEQEIDEELARDLQKTGESDEEGHDADDDDSSENTEPPPQIITNDLKSLHEMVKDLLNRCTCPSQFPMIRVSEGKYRIGDTKVLIFVRILRNHVMVRVGGGWDTLDHYLDKHDPCRCRAGHRLSTSAKLNVVQNKAGSSHMHVTYNRSPTSTNVSGGKTAVQVPASPSRTRRPHVTEKEKFTKTIRFPDGQDANNQGLSPRQRGSNNRPLSQLSDESSASSVGVSSAPRVNGNIGAANDSSSEFSENEARVGSWVAGIQARKCTPRKVLKIDSDQNEADKMDQNKSKPGKIRYSSDCSSVLSPEEVCMQNVPEDSPQSPKTMTGNGSDSSGIDVSCENLHDIHRAQGIKGSKIPTPKSDHKSKIPAITKSPLSTGMKRTVRMKSQSTDSLNKQSSFNPMKVIPNTNSSRRRAISHAGMTPASRIPRSRSASGDGLVQSYNLNREGLGRYSYRTPRPSDLPHQVGNRTWTFRQRNNRPSLAHETYMNPTASSQQRRISSSESPKKRSPLKSSENATPRRISDSAGNSPTREISPLLKEILANEEDLADDSKILQKMEMIVNQYKARVEANLKKGGEVEKKNARWNSTGDLSNERFLNPHAAGLPRKLSAPPSPTTNAMRGLEVSSRRRRDSLGSSSHSKIPMPRWHVKKL